ncbi:PH domain-containing protein [Bacillus sp. FJAT-45350]|uniref:PH domain-containing protein n=1 Tax=Bacillus sp. FJAT-45350 TaxID=2011014 RepID=UPI000BB7ED16|nr:PH domain-containing protein [Bacillus sp. FJAT-45350]
MINSKRLHPLAIFVSFLSLLKELIFPILITLFIGGTSPNRFFQPLIFMVIFLVGAFIYGIFYWITFRYQFSDGKLYIRKGVFIKRERSIQKERIQSYDIVAGVLQRMFGLVKVRIETAGGGGEPEVQLIAITRLEAEELREQLLKRPETQEENEELLDDAVLPIEKETDAFWKLSTKKLIYMALTSGGVGIVLSALIAIFTQVEQFVSERFYERTFVVFDGGGYFLVFILLFIIFVIAWIISIIATVLKYSDFNITKKDNELVISRGFLEKRQLTLHTNRITAIRIVRSIFRQPFGYVSVYVESGGGGRNEEQMSTVLFPMLKAEEIEEAFREIIPEYPVETEITKVPKRAWLRYQTRNLLLPVIVLAVVYWLLPFGVYLFALVPLFSLLGYWQYKDAGFSKSDQFVWLRSRKLNQTVVIVSRKKIQAVDSDQSPIQRMKRLATFRVSVLASISGKTFEVQDIDSIDSEKLLQWYSYDEKKQ